jgi:3',5'-cyclic AMP phosphodiesterase CpdA
MVNRKASDMKQIRQDQITRRSALRRVAKLGVFAGALGPAALRSFAADAPPEFKFIVVNDTHYMSEECGRYLEGVVRQMNQEGAELCLHVGDLTEKGERAHLKAVRRIFAGLDMPFYPVLGNHDYLTQTDRSAYVSLFPLRVNYSFRHRGWQFVGLDTTQGQEYSNTRIQPATFRMLDDILGRRSMAKPTVVFTHFPLCDGVQMRPVNARDLLARFDGWNVKAIFNGHFHGYTECKYGEATVTTNRCCALKRDNHDNTREKGYFVCTAGQGGVVRRFVEYRPA